jgi:PPP family 3-phenylpropionic acid transporter
LWALFLFTTDFRFMLVITIVYGAFYAPIISFLEAFAMDVLGKTKHRYGRTRAWGSVAFITVVLVVGKLIDRYDVGIVIAMVLAISAAQAMAATRMPRIRSQRAVQPHDAVRLLSGNTVVFLLCAFLMLVSHGAYYGFFSIHLAQLGHGGSFIGICWALASTAEVVVMINSPRLFARFSFKRVLAVSFAVAAIRWGILYVAESAAVILASQLLHAVTYGAFHMAGILYMDQLAPASDKTLGQALNNAVTYGLGLTVGFFVSGALYESGNSAAAVPVQCRYGAIRGHPVFYLSPVETPPTIALQELNPPCRPSIRVGSVFIRLRIGAFKPSAPAIVLKDAY